MSRGPEARRGGGPAPAMTARAVLAGAALLWMLSAGGGCGSGGDGEGAGAAGDEPALLAGGPLRGGPLALTHGGVGSPADWSPACQAAAQRAFLVLAGGGEALDAAVAGTIELENDPTFNAGTGANVRIDGRTIQMDAAVMTSEGRFAAVAAIERVLNPIVVARRVLDTPHLLLAGDGATRFAHRLGFADQTPICPEAVEKYRRRAAELRAGRAAEGYDTFDWRGHWNFPGDPPPELGGGEGGAGPDGARRAPEPPAAPAAADRTGDTVGAVVRDGAGRFAAALSTGGTSLTLYGRVGDVPIYGAGCYAGPAGAVACTGFGEEIIRQAVARTVYGFLERGLPAREAARRGCALVAPQHALGVIVAGRDGWGVAANRAMAYGAAR